MYFSDSPLCSTALWAPPFAQRLAGFTLDAGTGSKVGSASARGKSQKGGYGLRGRSFRYMAHTQKGGHELRGRNGADA